MITFDIETGPLDDLSHVMPEFVAELDDPGEFQESQVKTGNIRDPEKIRQKIEQERARHSQLRESLEARRIAEIERLRCEFISRAALSPATGRVVAIGAYRPENDAFIVQGDEPEAEILNAFWDLCMAVIQRHELLVGVNIFDFDLPFLVNRSWIIGVEVPKAICQFRGQWTNWHDCFVDLRRRWLLGRKGDEKSSFDWLGRVFGTGGKNTDCTGQDFARIWREDRDLALQYLKNDCMQPAQWATKMGIE